MTITVERIGKGATAFTFSAIANGEATDVLEMKNGIGLAASLQTTGTFDGGTVTLEVSNDGVTFYDWKDIEGTAIGMTAAGYAEFCVAARYVRLGLAGGAGGAMVGIIVAQG